jgi:putative FmdB family regulatory protein
MQAAGELKIVEVICSIDTLTRAYEEVMWMPIYEYECSECGERFEVRQAMGKDESDLRCPKCNAAKPRKLISAFFSQRSGDSSTADYSDFPSCPTGTCGLPPM